MNPQLAITAALEAFEVGDDRGAVDILLAAAEDGPTARPLRCTCGTRFAWPGELDHHQRFTCSVEEIAA